MTSWASCSSWEPPRRPDSRRKPAPPNRPGLPDTFCTARPYRKWAGLLVQNRYFSFKMDFWCKASNTHENSDLRTSVIRRGARKPPKGLRSKDTFTMRRSQMLLASSRGECAPKIASKLGCASQTVRDAIHDFNQRGLLSLAAESSRPKKTRDAFDQQSSEALREMLHRSPREFGYESSLWTLDMAADVAFEEGLTESRVSGETIRATLSRLLSVRWMRAKRWITSPDPLYERKKKARPTDGTRPSRSGVDCGL